MSRTRNIALLRGINVGGHRKLPMSELKNIFEHLGATDVETYIQSGNVVFSGDLRSRDIAAAIEAEKGFAPKVLIIASDAFSRAAEGNPFSEFEPKEMHLFFCEQPSQIDPADLTPFANGVEKWHLEGLVFYLFSPGGMSKSKLAEKLEKLLGVPATARNWNTVCTLQKMSQS